MSEIVYVFSNPSMPDYIKVGRTNRADVEKRLKELSNPTGVPAPFECLYAAEVADAQKVEDALHAAFDVDRPNKKREFFTTDPQRIIKLLKAFELSDESDAVQKVLDDNTSSEDKLAQHRIAEISERRSESIWRAKWKKKGWNGIVKGIGTRQPTLKEFGDIIRNIPFTKENVPELRKHITNAPKGIHHNARAALLELLDEKEHETHD